MVWFDEIWLMEGNLRVTNNHIVVENEIYNLEKVEKNLSDDIG
jgi:hypothetical protein